MGYGGAERVRERNKEEIKVEGGKNGTNRERRDYGQDET